MIEVTVTPRATELAAGEELGSWEHTSRLNTRRRSKVLWNVVPMILVGIGGLVWTLTLDRGGHAIPTAFLFGLIAVIGIGLIFPAYQLMRLGHLLLHRFEHGFIVERERGGVLSAPYARTTAQIIDYDEPGDSTSNPVPHVAVRFTFTGDEVLMVEEPHFGSPDALVTVAERCSTVERTPLSYLESQRLLRGADLRL